MARIEEAIEVAEGLAEKAISELAELIQDLAYYAEFQGVRVETQKAVLRAYRVLKPAVVFYRGDNSALVYEAPDYKFKSKEKQCH